ncbi:hypothetical protein [Candidatus Clostridium stratigraminis]|uniref:ABC-2 family transporter protein n=1 Tax=Candidatus Clostridium stratigraminis TaxID=3381661 RepID=A0ABW8T4V6_9CLOT
MGIGYVLGCFLSIIVWKFDRQNLFVRINLNLEKVIKNKIMLQLIYCIVILLICLLLNKIKIIELSNFITAFLVIDISNTEKKNLRQREKVKFYDSISIISKSMVGGFIAPLLLIVFFGNLVSLIYMFVYNVYQLDEDFIIFKFLFTIFTILPSFIAEVFLYIIYLFKNKRYGIDFKGDFFVNFIMRPLLNVDILGAYVESVNFYYLYSSKNTSYLKSYGEYSKKIDDVCVKDYLSIGYGICLIIFIIFFLLIK